MSASYLSVLILFLAFIAGVVVGWDRTESRR